MDNSFFSPKPQCCHRVIITQTHFLLGRVWTGFYIIFPHNFKVERHDWDLHTKIKMMPELSRIFYEARFLEFMKFILSHNLFVYISRLSHFFIFPTYKACLVYFTNPHEIPAVGKNVSILQVKKLKLETYKPSVSQ